MTPQARGPDAGTLLVRALRTMGAVFDIRVRSIAGRDWSSATFVGTRYVVTFTAPDVPELRSWIECLPDADIPLRGHLVADLHVDATETIDDDLRATLSVLTLQDS